MTRRPPSRRHGAARYSLCEWKSQPEGQGSGGANCFLGALTNARVYVRFGVAVSAVYGGSHFIYFEAIYVALKISSLFLNSFTFICKID